MFIFLLALFLGLCLLRVPIAFAMFVSSTLVIWIQGDVPLAIVPQRIWVGLNNFPLLAVPFFLLVGNMMNEGGLSLRLIDLARAMVGQMRGGLAHVNVTVCMIFAGISGVSSAETLGVGSVMIPAMKREGYPLPFTAGLTASASTLGNIIPPSLMMIVYAATGGVSVGALFLTGIVPGIMIGLLQMLYSWHVASRLGIGATTRFSGRALVAASRAAWLPLLIPVLVIGGIIGGLFTATEASVVAALYVMLLAAGLRTLGPRRMLTVTQDSIGMFSLSLLCVAAASLWGWLLAYYGIPQAAVAWCDRMGFLGSQYSVFAIIVLVLLVIGTFMDAVPAIIILQPIMGPMGASVGIDPYHMGIVVVLTLAIGLITPPYGLCLLIASDLAGLSMGAAMKAMLPFYVISLIVVAVAVFFPDLMLWIPRMALPNVVP